MPRKLAATMLKRTTTPHTSQNRLASETSPYLLQHQDNPVNWLPWSKQALSLAQTQDKPILLSVGYASCHWCHVMAHESFEDTTIAGLMNEHFINIKVDREERPDLDAIYQTALALLGGQGGWPLTMILMPDGNPFWGGTYFPPTPRYGLPGFPDVLKMMSDSYRKRPDMVAHNASSLSRALTDLSLPTGQSKVSLDTLEQAAHSLAALVDPSRGGLRGKPKFPQVPVFDFLWRMYRHTHDARLRDAAVVTMDRICGGGIYDHLAGGFCRYATDEDWLVPHFEKMLYDNAQLFDLLSEVWLETKNPTYAARVEQTVDWCLRDMTVKENDLFAFTSGYDADSENEEGKFYVWTVEEIDLELDEEADAFKKIYGVTSQGNWQGRTILNRNHTPSLDNEKFELKLSWCREKLLHAREKRTWPQRDDKVLADWNGMMITALANAGSIFNKPHWLKNAQTAFQFVHGEMSKGDRLCHSWCKGRKGPVSFLDDYAHMSRAALALFEATGRGDYLEQAQTWISSANKNHWDDAKRIYFLSPHDADDVIAPTVPISDNATPSGNGMMVSVLARLFHHTGAGEYQNRAMEIIHSCAGVILENSISVTSILGGYDLLQRPVRITVAGNQSDNRFKSLIDAIYDVSLPNRVVIRKDVDNNNPKAHVCTNQSCLAPIADTEVLKNQLSRL